MLFKPLHMTETRVERKRRLENDCARYYTRTGKRNKRQLRKAPYADLTAKIAGGGYVSTCMDLLRFAAALCAVPRSASPIVSAATRELLFAPVGDNYGLGWATLRDPLAPGGRWVYHTGGAVGASSIVLLNPEAEIAVTALTNIDDVSLKPLALRVARATLRSSGRVAPTV
jgi:CubicO group peptidase (beta-lactamase class C family)